VPVLILDFRTAGVFLLLTALATAISVPARLMAGADDTPFADALAQAQNLDAARIAQLEMAEKLAAIGDSRTAYAIGGAARLVGGITLLVAGLALWRSMNAVYPLAMGLAGLLLVASGIASAVSGASAVALSVLGSEPQRTVVLTSGYSIVGGAEDVLFTIRWVAGSLGFALVGLALVALAPVQWRMAGPLRAAALVEFVLGVAMLFIWVDAATVVHRISGIAFLILLVVAGLALATGRLRPEIIR
jgi:hypothetical protein